MNFWKIADVWHELMTGVLEAGTPPRAATSARWSPASSAQVRG